MIRTMDFSSRSSKQFASNRLTSIVSWVLEIIKNTLRSMHSVRYGESFTLFVQAKITDLHDLLEFITILGYAQSRLVKIFIQPGSSLKIVSL